MLRVVHSRASESMLVGIAVVVVVGEIKFLCRLSRSWSRSYGQAAAVSIWTLVGSYLKPLASAPFMVLPISNSRWKMRARRADETSSWHAAIIVLACSSSLARRDTLRTW